MVEAPGINDTGDDSEQLPPPIQTLTGEDWRGEEWCAGPKISGVIQLQTVNIVTSNMKMRPTAIQ